MSSKSRNRNRMPRPATPSRTVREEKRAQFEGTRSHTTLHIVGAVVALAIVAAIALYVTTGRGGSGVEAASTTAATGGDVKIALADVNDGKAHFYSYDANGVQVKYFVMKSADGVYRAAFDACDVCYPNKKGYHQEGDQMVCNNCGRRFDSAKINVLEGGCNPSPLDRAEKGKQLVIATSDLQAGVQYFQ